MKRLITDELDENRLAVIDFWALTGIGGGETSPTSLGHVLALSPAGMTQLIDRLEHRGLIQRLPNPADRRATMLSLTAEGRALHRKAAVRCTRLLDEFAKEFSPAGLAALEIVSRELHDMLARRDSKPLLAA
jgi:DNA-binding MarR family transcriptional regulator